jgi:hypothetical protein
MTVDGVTDDQVQWVLDNPGHGRRGPAACRNATPAALPPGLAAHPPIVSVLERAVSHEL